MGSQSPKGTHCDSTHDRVTELEDSVAARDQAWGGVGREAGRAVKGGTRDPRGGGAVEYLSGGGEYPGAHVYTTHTNTSSTVET